LGRILRGGDLATTRTAPKAVWDVLNVAGYYDALSLTAHAVAQGFLQASYRESVIVEEHPQQLLSQLGTAALPMEEKWVTTKER